MFLVEMLSIWFPSYLPSWCWRRLSFHIVRFDLHWSYSCGACYASVVSSRDLCYFHWLVLFLPLRLWFCSPLVGVLILFYNFSVLDIIDVSVLGHVSCVKRLRHCCSLHGLGKCPRCVTTPSGLRLMCSCLFHFDFYDFLVSVQYRLMWSVFFYTVLVSYLLYSVARRFVSLALSC